MKKNFFSFPLHAQHTAATLFKWFGEWRRGNEHEIVNCERMFASVWSWKSWLFNNDTEEKKPFHFCFYIRSSWRTDYGFVGIRCLFRKVHFVLFLRYLIHLVGYDIDRNTKLFSHFFVNQEWAASDFSLHCGAIEFSQRKVRPSICAVFLLEFIELGWAHWCTYLQRHSVSRAQSVMTTKISDELRLITEIKQMK